MNLLRHNHPWKHSPIMLSAALLFSMAAIFGDDPAEASVEDNPHVHHEINYIEIEVTDMDESKRFYAAAFDWERISGWSTVSFQRSER